MVQVAVQSAPWVKVLDAYGIARQRADAHPGPVPKTNRAGSLRPHSFDDCLHYCLPGVPDVYNGRLLQLLLDAASTVGMGAVAAAGAGAPPPSPEPELVEGMPGTLLARFNFDYAGERFVTGAPPRMALHLQPTEAPTLLECPLQTVAGGNEMRAVPPLLGFCSDFDKPSAFVRRRHAHGEGGERRNTSAPAKAMVRHAVGNGDGLRTRLTRLVAERRAGNQAGLGASRPRSLNKGMVAMQSEDERLGSGGGANTIRGDENSHGARSR